MSTPQEPHMPFNPRDASTWTPGKTVVIYEPRNAEAGDEEEFAQPLIFQGLDLAEGVAWATLSTCYGGWWHTVRVDDGELIAVEMSFDIPPGWHDAGDAHYTAQLRGTRVVFEREGLLWRDGADGRRYTCTRYVFEDGDGVMDFPAEAFAMSPRAALVSLSRGLRLPVEDDATAGALLLQIEKAVAGRGRVIRRDPKYGSLAMAVADGYIYVWGMGGPMPIAPDFVRPWTPNPDDDFRSWPIYCYGRPPEVPEDLWAGWLRYAAVREGGGR